MLLVIFFLTFIPSRVMEEDHFVPIDNNELLTPVVNAKGKELFEANCARCHALDRNMTGPSLRGFPSREPWTDREKIYEWIGNQVAFIDKYPDLEILVNTTDTAMPSFSYLTRDDIDAIIEYLNQEPGKPSQQVQYAVR
jgi:mono/diheme cytochrome c family protein